MADSDRASTLRRRWRRWRKKHGPEVLVRYRFTGTPEVDPADWPGVELKELTPALLDQMAQRYRRELTERKRQILAGRIGDAEQTCWVVVRQGLPLGYCHAAWNSTVNERIHHRVELAPDEVYLFDTFVFRKHRGRRLHRYAVARRLQIAAARGARAGVTIISAANVASQTSFAPFGAVATHTILYVPPLRRAFQWRRRSRR